jgi:hypothetical protein
MVKHWQAELTTGPGTGERRRIRRAQMINGLGGVATGLVLAIVLITKFFDGAYLVVIAIPVLYALMRGIKAHYATVAEATTVRDVRAVGPSRNHVLVLVSKVSGPTLRALAYARSLCPHTLQAVTVNVGDDESAELQRNWDAADLDFPLVVLDSPYREITPAVLPGRHRGRRSLAPALSRRLHRP